MGKPAPAPQPPTTPTPTWKFWQPMPFWHALLIMIGAHLVTSLMVVGIREGLGLAVPVAAAGAGGAFLGYFTIIERARKLRR